MAPLDWMDVQAAGLAGGERATEGAAEALLEDLNPAQRDAVLHGEGPLLILAGAGTGKTRAITRRIAWLVATGAAAPHEILAITFTNKAAREMRERVQALTDGPGMWISTFHAACARILRRDIESLGTHTRDFSIYDTYDRNQLLKKLIQDAGFDTTRYRPAAVGGWISDRKNRCAEGEESEESSLEADVFRRVERSYAEAMRASNALDFDDLLLETLRLYELHPGIRDQYARRFRYVLVDEYQDTNRIQYLLTRHWASHHGNLAVCGDPDQSIYAWRGADIRNILDFEQDFAGSPSGVRVIRLEQNYRSKANILRAAQAVVRHNVGRKEKDLWTEQEDGERLVLVECADENDEADEIAAQIRALVAQGRSHGDVAVFYRVNFMQRALERALRLAEMPYQIVGGVGFYERREIRDLVAYLQVLANPRDDVAARRIVNVPARGIGDKSLAVVQEWAAARGTSLIAAIETEEARALVRGRARAGLESFAKLVEDLRPLADAPASEALEMILERTAYLEFIGNLGDAEQVAREENIEELRSHARAYDEMVPTGKLRGFLQDIALVSDVDELEEGQPRVTLMTLHSAKGLEFPFVFLAGLEEGLLPHSRAVEAGPEGLEEERRLLYVGMTRARERLFLTHANQRMHAYGDFSFRMPSSFLQEIPRDLIEGHSTQEEEEEAGLGAFDAPTGSTELRVGDWVEHDHFGAGLVEQLRGSGPNARATVSFTNCGTKELLLQYAKLTVLRGKTGGGRH